MDKRNADFQGWATRFNLKCADGRTIRDSAFKDQDGMSVPLVWNHNHDDPTNVLGHAILEYKPGKGMWAYGFFNDTELAHNAKIQVQHRDITNLSIWANKLKQNGGDVLHGMIREVSLVLAGANPGAFIESVLAHSGDISEDEAIIYGDDPIEMAHADEEEPEDTLAHSEEEKKEEPKMADEKKTDSKTVKDVIDSMSEEQRNVMNALIGMAVADAKGENNSEEDDNMHHSIYDRDQNTQQEEVLAHSEIMAAIADGKRYGSLKESFLEHGIHEIETLFPEAKTLNNPPEYIGRDQSWVSGVMSSVHKSPFSRIKSVFADITEDEARAKGYIKGKFKKEEFFSTLRRVTTPCTIYKKQKLDRDDVVDITDFDVVAWIRGEMRGMLNEEIARSILIGDGRLASDEDKIPEDHIRPIWTDADLFTIKTVITVPPTATEDERAKAVIRAAIKSRKGYKGSGSPKFYTTEDVLTDALLLEDKNGRVIYDAESKVATAMRVNSIVTVPVMEGQSREVSGKVRKLVGLIVNLSDYNVGADKGGEVNMFDDFDIDYNQMKYLIETRISGALTKPFSAIAIEMVEDSSAQKITITSTTMQDGLAPYKPDHD